jgi:hypothetical protein
LDLWNTCTYASLLIPMDMIGELLLVIFAGQLTVVAVLSQLLLLFANVRHILIDRMLNVNALIQKIEAMVQVAFIW